MGVGLMPTDILHLLGRNLKDLKKTFQTDRTVSQILNAIDGLCVIKGTFHSSSTRLCYGRPTVLTSRNFFLSTSYFLFR
jgi:hypothetical protein